MDTKRLLKDHMLSTMIEPLTQDLIKQFHYELKSGVFEDRANGYAIGDYKKRANMVGNQKTCLPADVPEQMNKLMEWYQNQTISLETIAEFHLKYETLHPFQDGNGRTGRLIVYRECLKNDIIPLIIEDKNRKRYIEAFGVYREKEDVRPMQELFQAEQDAYLKECEYFYENNLE